MMLMKFLTYPEDKASKLSSGFKLCITVFICSPCTEQTGVSYLSTWNKLGVPSQSHVAPSFTVEDCFAKKKHSFEIQFQCLKIKLLKCLDKLKMGKRTL